MNDEMIHDICDYLKDNEEVILEKLEDHEWEDICMEYYTDFITGVNSMNTREGFQCEVTKKYIKKFVTTEFNLVYLLFEQQVKQMRNNHLNQEEEYLKKKEQLSNLLEIKTYTQRTPEWYAFRRGILTASDLATAFDKGHFNSRDDLILSKIDPQPWMGNQATEWGVKYEEVATQLYQKKNDVKVLEFGLVPHPTIDIFGASPDGIVDDTGNKELTARMLEIKCPWKRKIEHGEVPWHYWTQIQGQLDSCDLDYCDFVQVKLVEYPTRHDYLEDKDNTDKGLIIATWDKDQEHIGSPKYHYCSMGLTSEEEEKWMGQFFDETKYDIEAITHWHVSVYSCHTVARDKAWFNAIVPEIYRFIEDLNYWKEKGKDEMVAHIAGKKNKRKKERELKKKEKIENGTMIKESDLLPEIPNVCIL